MLNDLSLELFEALDSRISGQVPSEIGSLSSLRTLDLGMTYVEGTIPTEIGQLSSLEGFSISANRGITGTLPSEVGLLSSLESFLAPNTGLSGILPSELGLLENISEYHTILALLEVVNAKVSYVNNYPAHVSFLCCRTY
jgi:hypothetical protein